MVGRGKPLGWDPSQLRVETPAPQLENRTVVSSLFIHNPAIFFYEDFTMSALLIAAFYQKLFESTSSNTLTLTSRGRHIPKHINFGLEVVFHK